MYHILLNRKDWGALIIVDDRFVRNKDKYCKGKLPSLIYLWFHEILGIFGHRDLKIGAYPLKFKWISPDFHTKI